MTITNKTVIKRCMIVCVFAKDLFMCRVMSNLSVLSDEESCIGPYECVVHRMRQCREVLTRYRYFTFFSHRKSPNAYRKRKSFALRRGSAAIQVRAEVYFYSLYFEMIYFWVFMVCECLWVCVPVRVLCFGVCQRCCSSISSLVCRKSCGATSQVCDSALRSNALTLCLLLVSSPSEHLISLGTQ